MRFIMCLIWLAWSGASAAPSACAAQNELIRQEICSEKTCAVSFPCAHLGDFDGDGKADRVVFASVEGRRVLRFTFGAGHTRIVGLAPIAYRFYKEPELAPTTWRDDFSWLFGWSTAYRTGKVLTLRKRRRFDFPGALGDGLWLTGTDAAAMLVLTSKGWVLTHLGY